MARFQTDYDVAVIGAGIQGVGAAQALAAQGYRVVLLERNSAPGMETSRNSSKLIHGGLRYLANGQWRLVRECLRERAILLNLAPKWVKPAAFVIPVYKGQGRGRMMLHLGLILYRLLGGGYYRFRAANELGDLGLKKEGLLGGFEYQDAQTDDQALTQAVCQSAQALGVDVFYDCTFIKGQYLGYFELELLHHNPHVQSVKTQPVKTQTIKTQAVVNAAGPWVNYVAARIKGIKPQPVDWVQGSHIVIKRVAFDECIYLQTHDNRAVFVLPWYGQMLIGTTEKLLSHVADKPGGNISASDDEVAYLIKVFNDNFPTLKVTQNDIVEYFCGIRCLPASAKNTHAKSRDTLIDQQTLNPNIILQEMAVQGEQKEGQPFKGQYIAIYGGKLTAYRATAQKVVKALKNVLPSGTRHLNGDTQKIPLE